MTAGKTARVSLDERSRTEKTGRTLWRPALSTWLLAVVVILGVGAALYPSTAQWLTSYNQAQIVRGYQEVIDTVDAGAGGHLSLAQRYNDALTAGVDFLSGASVPTGTGISSDHELVYPDILSTDPDSAMARIRFPAAKVDMPVYHGTSDATLLKGAGHLEGTHLPVGGESTRSVITAHRGLASAAMFNHLDQVEQGDRFTIEVFGEVLTYEVREISVIQPTDNDSLRTEPGRDLVTLVTCTPLGINTHRILVTGERVTPTPIQDVEAMGERSDLPGFPWWALAVGFTVVIVVGFVWRSGYTDQRTSPAHTPSTT